jgi:hypothetical protein
MERPKSSPNPLPQVDAKDSSSSSDSSSASASPTVATLAKKAFKSESFESKKDREAKRPYRKRVYSEAQQQKQKENKKRGRIRTEVLKQNNSGTLEQGRAGRGTKYQNYENYIKRIIVLVPQQICFIPWGNLMELQGVILTDCV